MGKKEKNAELFDSSNSFATSSGTASIGRDLPVLPASNFDVSTPLERIGTESLFSVIGSYVHYYASGEGHTARAKRYDLQYFLEFLAAGRADVKNIPVSFWTMQATKDFIDHRLNCGEAPATVARRLATIKHFGRTLAERVHGFINPAREVKSPVIQQTRPHGLSAEEIQLLRQAVEDLRQKKLKDPFLFIRNKFLLELLLATGLRADEVRVLYTSQIADDGAWLKNVKTKGRKFRNVYLDTRIRELFASYLAEREQELIRKFPLYPALSAAEKTRYPVFISLYSAALAQPSTLGLAPKTIWRIIAEIGARARALAPAPMSNLHPHKLRHTFAHGLLDTSKDVRLVAQALGHSDVRTTMRYTERTEQELARAIEEKVSRGF